MSDDDDVYAQLEDGPASTAQQESSAVSAWKKVFSDESASYGSIDAAAGATSAASGCCSAGKCSSAESPSTSIDVGGCCSSDAAEGCCSTDACAESSLDSPWPRDGGPVCTLSWYGLALIMAWFSVFWNIGEVSAGLYVGLRHLQLSVLANAGQSGCEVVSALLVLWRLRAEGGRGGLGAATKAAIVTRERKGVRLMGFMFVTLALAVVAGCVIRFVQHEGPSDTLPGLLVSAAAATAMLVLYFLKLKASRRLNSQTLLEDARCSFMCFKLSCCVMIGSVIHMERGRIQDSCGSSEWCDLFWIDGALACALSLIIFRDGIRSIRMSYAEDFDGGCGCCASEKKPTSSSSSSAPVTKTTTTTVTRVRTTAGQLQQGALEPADVTASPMRSGEDEDDDIYGD